MANIITGIRFLCAAGLLFCPALSVAFYGLYVIGGFTDMIDGTIARRTHADSEFGARLDTVADLVFVLVCLLKLLPVLDVPVWLAIWIGVIALIKVINIVSGYVMRRRLVAVHSVMNKATGMLLFVLPLTLPVVDLRYSGAVACAVATFAAVQEGHYIRTGRAE